METKELKITIPENHEIDWQESAKQEKIVFKKKENTKPRSWEEYCKQTPRDRRYYIGPTSSIITSAACCENEPLSQESDKNLLPSKELAEAFRAMMQLMSLRQDWIHKWSVDSGMTNDWKPDFDSCAEYKWCIEVELDKVRVVPSLFRHYALNFPTLEMATDFMNCFKDLLEVAKPLI